MVLMENNTEKKLPVRNLERISERKFKTYAEAKAATTWAGTWKTDAMPVKIKIFARNDNTFDVVWYKKIQADPVVEPVVEKVEKVPFKKGKKQSR